MRVLCALAVVCLLVRVELSSGQCPSDFQFLNNKCYKVSTSNAPRDQAMSTCQAMGARLLSPQDAAQQAGVENILRFQQASWEYIWTSLKEEKTSWRWYPNNNVVQVTRSVTSECFTRASATTLFELTYLKDTSFTSESCEDACRSWLGNTYRESAVTVKACANEGAACLNGMQAACFCGNSEVQNPEPATCNTPCPLDTSLICGAQTSFYRSTISVSSGWAPDQPKLANGNELCMALGYGHQFQWIAKMCSTLMRYACKYAITTQEACTQSGKTWFPDTGLCFKISTEAYTWFDARQQCKLENGELLQPPVSDNYRLLVSNMVTAYTGTKQNVNWDVWTAGVATELKWSDGNSVSYTNFAENRPDIMMGNCIALSKQSSPVQYQWDSRSCQESQPFICEMAASSITPTPTPAPTTTTTTTTTSAPTTTTTATTTTTLSTASSAPPTPQPTTTTSTTTTTTTRRPVQTPAPATPSRPGSTRVPVTQPPPHLTRTPPSFGTTPPPASTRRIPSTATPRQTGFPTSTRSTTTDKDKTGGDGNTLGGVAGKVNDVFNSLTLGTKIVIGIVAFVVVISLILMIVFICQRRRKESLRRAGFEDRHSKQDAYIESYHNRGFEDTETGKEPANYNVENGNDGDDASTNEGDEVYQNGQMIYAY